MTGKMNPEVKAEWVKALRSGDYKQGSGVLRSAGGEFCCLGVLCDLATKAGVVRSVVTSGDAYLYDGASAYLPLTVEAWSGVTAYGEIPGREDFARWLTNINDDGTPFPEIADLIDKEF